jgi:adenosylcobinamide amidohydrolase
MSTLHWDTLLEGGHFLLRRAGRYLVADLGGVHDVISTSVRNGGQTRSVRHLVNHQSCEGAGHADRQKVMLDLGLDGYHDELGAEIALPADSIAVMGTAANMNYAAMVTKDDEDVSVTAVVTAGVESNATCAGDPAHWRETAAGMTRVADYAGTINTMVLINRPLQPGALARAVVTLTEAKSAALQRLAVPSRQSVDLATGTGTDQFCLAAPVDGTAELASTSTHVKLGELIGVSVRDATLEALRWQNGLEASYTRGIFHALGRYGVREATIFDDLAPFLDASALELLRKNTKSVFYEPLAGAAAHALATVLDRTRHGSLPVTAEAAVHQAASLAAGLAAQPHRWPEFRAALQPYAHGDAKTLALAAIALGWSGKWPRS